MVANFVCPVSEILQTSQPLSSNVKVYTVYIIYSSHVIEFCSSTHSHASEKMGPSNSSCLSNTAIFHFYDHGRKCNDWL